MEQVRLQFACPEGVAESSSTVDHVGCAVNLTEERCLGTVQESIKGPHTVETPHARDNIGANSSIFGVIHIQAKVTSLIHTVAIMCKQMYTAMYTVESMAAHALTALFSCGSGWKAM